MSAVRWLVSLALWCVISTAVARDIEGIPVSETVTLADTPLVLNGAGVRKKFFVKVYVGALYLPKKETRAQSIIVSAGAKSVRLHILYAELDSQKLADAWTDGIKANHGDTEFQALVPRLTQFNGLFRTVRRGDTIRVDLMPNGETHVMINEEMRGVVSGADFQRALLTIWLGEKPVDENLKQALLGGIR